MSLFDDMASSSIEDSVDSSNYSLWTLDFDQVDWFKKSRLSSQDGSIEYSPRSWDDLSTSSMNGISMKSNIMDVESNSSKIFVAQNRL